MANNVFLLKRERANELGLNPVILNNRTVSELIALADYVVPAMDVIRNLSGLSPLVVFDGTREVEISLDDYILIPKHVDDEEFPVVLHEDDAVDILINGELELHIKRNDIGYSFDFYNPTDAKAMEEDDYDFDGDFIKGFVIEDDELASPTPVEVTVDSLDGSDEQIIDEWFLSGLRLSSTFDNFIVRDKDELIETILNAVHGHVACIKIDNEPIYED